jgi:hypothetical protein
LLIDKASQSPGGLRDARKPDVGVQPHSLKAGEADGPSVTLAQRRIRGSGSHAARAPSKKERKFSALEKTANIFSAAAQERKVHPGRLSRLTFPAAGTEGVAGCLPKTLMF